MKKIKQFISNHLITLHISFFFLVSLIFTILFLRYEQHFIFLSQSFLTLKTYFLDVPGGTWMDTLPLNGHYYWPQGPFPAIILMPLVSIFNLFGQNSYQGFLNFPIGIGVFYLVYLIAKNVGFKKQDSLYWAAAFCFASVFTMVFYISFSWYFAQSIAVFLILLFIYLFYIKKRAGILIGTIVGFLAATRPLAALACIAFSLLHIISTNKSVKIKLLNLFKIYIASPFPLIILLLLIYNKISFGNYFSGYGTNINIEPSLIKAREYGVFNLVHVPGNIYYSLLSLPTPVFKDGLSHVLSFPFLQANPWGTSLFFVSPYLFYLFVISYKKAISKILLGVSLFIYLPLLFFYGIGYVQYGYRYALDFFLFLFLLLLLGYKEKFGGLTNSTKTIIILSAFINLWFISTLYLPFLN